MLNRSASIRAEFVKALHKAWESATQRERAVWIKEIRSATLNSMQKACGSLLQGEPSQEGKQ